MYLNASHESIPIHIAVSLADKLTIPDLTSDVVPAELGLVVLFKKIKFKLLSSLLTTILTELYWVPATATYSTLANKTRLVEPLESPVKTILELDSALSVSS